MWSSAPGKLRTELLAACAEAPPPPFAQVAVRFDAPKDYFAKHIGKMYRWLA